MPHPMMKCGHAANAEMEDGRPVCAICAGLKAGADEVDANPPCLTGRRAKCADCENTAPSSPNLAFFEYLPNSLVDKFYCGCFGWD